jgi:hypothetical protein
MALAGLFAVLAFIVWIGFKSAEKKGRAEAEREQFQAKSEAATEAHEIDEAVLRLSDADLDRELRDGR